MGYSFVNGLIYTLFLNVRVGYRLFGLALFGWWWFKRGVKLGIYVLVDKRLDFLNLSR